MEARRRRRKKWETSGNLSDFRIFSGIINGSAPQAPKKYVLRQETLGTYGISGNFPALATYDNFGRSGSHKVHCILWLQFPEFCG